MVMCSRGWLPSQFLADELQVNQANASCQKDFPPEQRERHTKRSTASCPYLHLYEETISWDVAVLL